jgi:hypothetical protein
MCEIAIAHVSSGIAIGIPWNAPALIATGLPPSSSVKISGLSVTAPSSSSSR